VVLASSASGAALPLDFRAWGNALPPALRTLGEAGLACVALVSPDLAHVKAAHAVGMLGVELYTGALVDLPLAERALALAGLGDAARLAELRLEVAIGGRLDGQSLAAVLEAAPIATSIGGTPSWRGRAIGGGSCGSRPAGAGTGARVGEDRTRARIPTRYQPMLADIWPLPTVAEMQALDRFTSDTLGVRRAADEAGRAAVAREVGSLRTEPSAGLGVLRAGNNGGDGLVVARQLHLRGRAVRVVPVPASVRWRGDSAANAERARAAGVPFSEALAAPEPGAVVVDAIFGTGLSRAVDGAAAAAIGLLREARPACTVLPSTCRPARCRHRAAARRLRRRGPDRHDRPAQARPRARARSGPCGRNWSRASASQTELPDSVPAPKALDPRRCRPPPAGKAGTATRAASGTCWWWPAPRARRAPRRSRRSALRGSARGS
jgi:NAD(P)H-hydrate repair Nnr-like enzyme with NAD(P)H-hydrate epimerase domain